MRTKPSKREETPAAPEVSANNPCPFLRALVAGGHIDGHREPLAHVKGVIAAARGGTPVEQRKVGYASYVIALVANGLWPADVIGNCAGGFAADELRGGPFDKQGAGSRILDVNGCVVEAQLARLDEFALNKTDVFGAVERGLGARELRQMMNANFERAVGARRRIDRQLMEGEWPVLLLVMGKPGVGGVFLSLAELRLLFADRRLPERVIARIEADAST